MASDSELIRQTAGTAFDMWQKFAFMHAANRADARSSASNRSATGG